MNLSYISNMPALVVVSIVVTVAITVLMKTKVVVVPIGMMKVRRKKIAGYFLFGMAFGFLVNEIIGINTIMPGLAAMIGVLVGIISEMAELKFSVDRRGDDIEK